MGGGLRDQSSYKSFITYWGEHGDCLHLFLRGFRGRGSRESEWRCRACVSCDMRQTVDSAPGSHTHTHKGPKERKQGFKFRIIMATASRTVRSFT